MMRNLFKSTQIFKNIYQTQQFSFSQLARVAVFHAKSYDHQYLTKYNEKNNHQLDLQFFEQKLSVEGAKNLKNFNAVCAFVNDNLSRQVLEQLKQNGVDLIAMRCAGTNNVDLQAAKQLGIRVVRVPKYGPECIAQHALALLMCLTRKIHKAHNRTRDGNFSIEGLEGTNLVGKTVGIIGFDKIGKRFASICNGLGMKILVNDIIQLDQQTLKEYNAVQADRATLLAESDVLSLHCPLTEQSRNMINSESIKHIKKGQVIINTARGALIDHKAIIAGLRSRQIGGLGMDVYENEQEYFFEDHSWDVIKDDNLATLMSFPNVLITAHQAFFVKEALDNLYATTVDNILQVKTTGKSPNLIE